MKSRVLAVVGIAALVLSACGGGGGGKQDEVADMMLEAMDDEGVDMDEGCVRDAAGELSDDDAQKILDAGPDGNAEGLSDDAQAAASSLINCIDTDEIVDQMVDEMVGEMGSENVDVDCLKDAIGDLDLSTFDEGNPEMMSAMFECIDIGG